MPKSTNDLKFQRKRKYFELDSNKHSVKLQFDLKDKKIFQEKEKIWCHRVSEQILLKDSQKCPNNTENSQDMTHASDNAGYESEQRGEVSWNYFSFSQINQDAYEENNKFSNFSNGSTLQDLELPTYSLGWKGLETGGAQIDVCSIQNY